MTLGFYCFFGGGGIRYIPSNSLQSRDFDQLFDTSGRCRVRAADHCTVGGPVESHMVRVVAQVTHQSDHAPEDSSSGSASV